MPGLLDQSGPFIWLTPLCSEKITIFGAQPCFYLRDRNFKILKNHVNVPITERPGSPASWCSDAEYYFMIFQIWTLTRRRQEVPYEPVLRSWYIEGLNLLENFPARYTTISWYEPYVLSRVQRCKFVKLLAEHFFYIWPQAWLDREGIFRSKLARRKTLITFLTYLDIRKFSSPLGWNFGNLKNLLVTVQAKHNF